MRWIIAFGLLFCLAGCASFSGENKERADLHTQIGNGHFEHHNWPLALREYLEAEKLDPSSPIIQNNLGLTYFMRDRYDMAEKHLKKALELQPNYSDARNNLARIYIDRGRYQEAEAELKKVLNDLTYSGVDRAWLNLGMSHFNQKKWSEARNDFTQSLKVSRESCFANSYYGRTFFETEDYPRAAETLDRAIGYCEKQLYDEPHYFSALAWYRTGDKERSIARFEEVLKLYPNGKYREKARAMLDLIRKGVE